MLQIVMPYIGGCLSVNGYRIIGRGGRPTHCIRPEVKLWMADLTSKVRGFYPGSNLAIHLRGKFYDDRAPDLANLHKVIGDAIKVGTLLDDKSYDFVDEGYLIGFARPLLEMDLVGNHEILVNFVPQKGATYIQ
jgi:hypothetical protein